MVMISHILVVVFFSMMVDVVVFIVRVRQDTRDFGLSGLNVSRHDVLVLYILKRRFRSGVVSPQVLDEAGRHKVSPV
jgi:hypothetical protein